MLGFKDKTADETEDHADQDLDGKTDFLFLFHRDSSFLVVIFIRNQAVLVLNKNKMTALDIIRARYRALAMYRTVINL